MTIRIPHRTIALQEKQIVELELQLAQALNEKAVLEEENKILNRQLEIAFNAAEASKLTHTKIDELIQLIKELP